MTTPAIHRPRRRARRRAAALAAVLGAAVAAPAPAAATAPLDVQQRISQMGPDGDVSFQGVRPSVAYNPRTDQYLAVWSGNAVGEELEIWGRLLDARGAPAGGQLRISDMGPDGDPDFQGTDPGVAYNPRTNEYLVAWQGWDETLGSGEEEIFVQRLTAAGAESGANDARISAMGADGDVDIDAGNAAVAADAGTGDYLVAWQGDDVADGEDEVFVQRLDAAANQIGADDLRASDMGPEGDLRFDAREPAVAHNVRSGEYLVAWAGAEGAAGDDEIHVQRLGAGGAEIGPNDQRISDTGPAFARAGAPAVAASERSGDYLVAWDGDDSPPLSGGEREIFVQRLDAAGAEVGADDRRVSDMGPDGDPEGRASDATVAYDLRSDEYLVAWMGRTPPELAVRKDEVFAQRLDAAGAETGANDMRVSVMGADADPDFSGLFPAVAYGSQANEYLLVWEGGDQNAPDVDNESEIHARRVGAGAPPPPAAAVCLPLAPAPAATPGDPDKVTLSVAQLLINQRIDQAAIRRANGVQAWLDAGVEARDVCQGAIGRPDLRADVATGFTALPLTLGPPSPRPVRVPPAGRPDPGAVRLTAGQVLINQRISQAAIRRLNALKARLDAGLTGGDVGDGQLGRTQLAAGTAILAAPPPAGPPPPSTTRIAPAKAGDPGAVTLTVSQLLINQRISQAGVRRANDLIRRLDAGLGAAEIADGSLTGADLAPGVALSTG